MRDPKDTAPVCPGPPIHQGSARRFAVPPGAVDTHCHVIAGPADYPMVDTRSYTPPPAPLPHYLAMLDATGMTYGVLVQVSVHGTDNRLLVEALRAEPARLRGIAVVAPDVDDRTLRELQAAGVRGLRLNVLYGGGVGFEQMERYGAICRDMGWHLQFLLDAGALPGIAGRLAKLPVPFVIDHMGHFPVSRGLDDPGFRTLVSLVGDGAWVKLQGAYRITAEGPPWHDTIPFARKLHAAAPGRCVWGSDWPHVSHWGDMMEVADLLDLLADWVPDQAARTDVLVRNAHQLYGFPPAGLPA